MSLDLSKTATSLLSKLAVKKESGSIVFNRLTDVAFNPTIGEVVGGTVVETSVNGAVTSYNQRLINGTTIKDGDVLVVIDNEYEPKEDDKLFIYGVEHKVVSIITKNHAGTVQVYQVQARR